MNNLMVDNWFMEEVIADIRDGKIEDSQYYTDLLMAIVLWDEVYYPRNQYNWWNSVDSQVQNVLHPIDDSDEYWKKESIEELCRYKGVKIDDWYWLKWKDSSLVNSDDIMRSGAIRYLALSSKNGLDYLPCIKRQKFLREYLAFNNKHNTLTRLQFQKNATEITTKLFLKEYELLNDELNIKIKMPMLAKFVYDNTPHNMTPIEYALHLKNEGPIIRFRQYLGEIDNAIENEKKDELRYLLALSREVIDDVILMDRKSILSFDLDIGIVPAIIFKKGNAEAKISPTPSVRIKDINLFDRKYNLTFFRDVSIHTINDIKKYV